MLGRGLFFPPISAVNWFDQVSFHTGGYLGGYRTRVVVWVVPYEGHLHYSGYTTNCMFRSSSASHRRPRLADGGQDDVDEASR